MLCITYVWCMCICAGFEHDIITHVWQNTGTCKSDIFAVWLSLIMCHVVEKGGIDLAISVVIWSFFETALKGNNEMCKLVWKMENKTKNLQLALSAYFISLLCQYLFHCSINICTIPLGRGCKFEFRALPCSLFTNK